MIIFSRNNPVPGPVVRVARADRAGGAGAAPELREPWAVCFFSGPEYAPPFPRSGAENPDQAALS